MRQKQSIFSLFLLSPSSRRAWIEIALLYFLALAWLSPSSRRAWIEMKMCCSAMLMRKVALLAEGVDRNLHLLGCSAVRSSSPSSRRAWIEMLK